MARGGKQFEGQMNFFDMSLTTNNYVVQSNTLISGKQGLKINSAKLVRAAIMQVVKEDEELKPYKVTIQELSDLLGVPSSNIYRDINDITDDIMNNPVYIKEINNHKVSWVKIPWVSRCDYNPDIGIAIKLNDELKPYLVNLKDHYTQYTLESILCMKSIYAIRIYEMIQQKIMIKIIPKIGTDVQISLKEIRESCDCEEKYEKFSHLKKRVIDIAVKEINEKTLYAVSYDYIKKGRAITGLLFHVNMSYH